MIPSLAIAASIACWAVNPAAAQQVLGGPNLPNKPPSNSIGNEANWYIDWASGKVFGPKTLGSWPATPVAQFNSTVAGAACDAGTDATAVFASALAGSGSLILPPGKTCLLTNLALNTNQTLDCNNSILEPASATALYIIYATQQHLLRNCTVYDPNLWTMKTTTLSSNVSPGATTIPVASSANFLPNMVVTIQLASGAYWISKILTVTPGQITIQDPIPSTIASNPTINAGGSGYTNNAECIILNGVGPPATGHITTSAGALTAFTIDAPGLYQTAPGATPAIYCPSTIFANSAALNVTYSGASSGAFVDAAFGLVTIDNAFNGYVENINIPLAPVGIELLQSAGGGTTEESIFSVNANAILMTTLAKLTGVNNSSFRGIRAFGYNHHATTYGTAGIYIDANSSVASGGNKWDVALLGFENGGQDLGGTLDTFDHVFFDTVRNYGFNCIGCTGSDFAYLGSTFSGPQATQGTGGKGIGVYFGSSGNNNSIGKFTTHDNASDIHFGDQVSAVWIDNLAWAWSKIITGWSIGLQPGYNIAVIPTSAAISGSSAEFLVPGLISTTEGNAVINGLRGNITSFYVGSSTAPGAATFTVLLRIAQWNGNTWNAWTTAAPTCSFTGTTQGCLYGGPFGGVALNPQDKFALEIVPSGGSFPANTQFTAYIQGQ